MSCSDVKVGPDLLAGDTQALSAINDLQQSAVELNKSEVSPAERCINQQQVVPKPTKHKLSLDTSDLSK